MNFFLRRIHFIFLLLLIKAGTGFGASAYIRHNNFSLPASYQHDYNLKAFYLSDEKEFDSLIVNEENDDEDCHDNDKTSKDSFSNTCFITDFSTVNIYHSSTGQFFYSKPAYAALLKLHLLFRSIRI